MTVIESSVTTASPRLSAWRVVTWVLLLLAAFGAFEYCVHAWHVATALHAGRTATSNGLAGILAWDIAYLVGACVVLIVSAGALLHRGWARPVLRVVALALALWLLATAIVLTRQLGDFNERSGALLMQSGVTDVARAMVVHARRSYLIAIVLKAVGVPLLAWLAWRLGAASVRAQFHVSSARKMD